MATSYINSDFQSDIDFKKFTLGYVFTLGGGAISWNSVKQSCIVNSTLKIEYVVACEVIKKLFGLRNSFMILVL